MENKVKTWFAVDIVCLPAAAEAMESAFNQVDALGTEIYQVRDHGGQPIRVSGYFDAVPDEGAVRAAAGESLRIYGLGPDTLISIASRQVEQTDWLAEWKKHWRPTVIGRFVVAPPWKAVDEDGKFVIRIEPNMAFGTGTHETTKLCLRKIDKTYRPEQSFLDVGTGTGILAIAAAKLGGTRVAACDTDLDSVAIASENAVLNGVGDAIEYFDGSIDDGTPVSDFVCANLTIDVILPMLGLLLSKTGEVLLLSGILAEQKAMITEALDKRGISDFEIDTDGEWISVLVNVR
jgi:ribosomal protein L11 methyltransferase